MADLARTTPRRVGVIAIRVGKIAARLRPVSASPTAPNTGVGDHQMSAVPAAVPPMLPLRSTREPSRSRGAQ